MVCLSACASRAPRPLAAPSTAPPIAALPTAPPAAAPAPARRSGALLAQDALAMLGQPYRMEAPIPADSTAAD